MTDENDNGRATSPGGRAPLTLKPRSGGAVSAGVVKQSFSHGRSKTVVVETKRRRVDAPPGANLAGPSAAEKRPVFDVRGPAPQRPAPPLADAHGLSEDERLRRQKVAGEFARQQAERAAAEARAQAEAARAREAEAPKPAAPAPPPAAEAPPPTAVAAT